MASINTAATLLLWMHPGAYLFALFSQVKSVKETATNSGAIEDINNSRVNVVYHSIIKECFPNENLGDVSIFLSQKISLIEAFTSYKDRCLLVCPYFVQKDEDAFRFVCKREISHILDRDPTKNLIKMAIVLNTAMFVIRHHFNCSIFATVSSYIGILTLARKLFTGPSETKADDFAIKYATENELKGGLRWLKTQETYFFSLLDIVNSTFGPFSPAHVRAKKVQEALEQKGVIYHPTKDDLNPLKDVFSFALKLSENTKKYA